MLRYDDSTGKVVYNNFHMTPYMVTGVNIYEMYYPYTFNILEPNDVWYMTTSIAAN